MTAPPALMLQGTGSDVGKSLLVAGLGRACARRGLRVRPFKPQNMSNNAGVTADGGEIGRAQMLQARACGVAPSIHMNPVLLKPQSEKGAQIVVRGRVAGRADARRYHRLKPHLMPAVLESYRRLCREADLVLVEGAGSPAEVNLRDSDIANMGFALAASVPVLLVGDIDRGGVIASLVGTMALIEPAERALVRGYVVNKFRGDIGLFDDAIAILKRRTGLDCLGVVPHLEAARRLPAEDAVVLESASRSSPGARKGIRIAVPRLDRIANFDDLDPLGAEPDVDLVLIGPREPIPGDADLVLLPGSKSTLADLRALKRHGWDIDIAAHRRRGGAVLGLCGGYQMLGREVADPRRHRGRGGPRARSRPAAREHRAARRQEAGEEARQRRQRRAGGRIRDAYGRDGRPPTGRVPCCGWRAATTARSRKTAGSWVAISTASSARTPFARASSPGWRRATAAGSISTPASTRPSTASPTASRPASTSIGSWRSPVPAEPFPAPIRPALERSRRGRDGDQPPQDAGPDIEREGAAHVGGRAQRAAAAAHPGAVARAVAIGARPGERDAEGAGERGLRPAGIGRVVARSVAAHRGDGPAGRGPGQRRGGGRQGEAGHGAKAAGSANRRNARPPGRTPGDARSCGRSWRSAVLTAL